MKFLEKYELLKKSIPVPAVIRDKTSINCELVDYCSGCKNCFYSFYIYKSEDCIYTTWGWGNKLVDCTVLTKGSEKCYQCVDSNNCNNCIYLLDCNNCTDCNFSAYLNSCSDCIGCVALTHKKYCIFNKQYTKEEYLMQAERLKKEKPEKALEQMLKLKKTIPHPASQQFNSVNCPYGNYIYNSKNCFWCFNTYDSESIGYSNLDGGIRKCFDTFWCGGPRDRLTENCYQLVGSGLYYNCYNCAFLTDSEGCTNCYYGRDLKNCSDCFGCVSLTNKKYSILNNQLSKEQYEKAIKDIRKELGWK